MRNKILEQLAIATGATILRHEYSDKFKGMELSAVWIDEADKILLVKAGEEFLKKWNERPRPLTQEELTFRVIEPASEKLPDYHHKDLKRAVLGKKKSRWS